MNSFIKKFFYLLLTLPLGIFYFVVILTGLSLATGLFVVTLGIPIFTAVFGFATVFSKYEESLANNFLEVNIPIISSVETPKGIWVNFKTQFLDGKNWMRIFYLIAKLPLGIFTFTIEVTLFFVSITLILTPFLYGQSWYRYVGVGFWHITTLGQALLASVGGIILAIIFYYTTKALAAISEAFVKSALV